MKVTKIIELTKSDEEIMRVRCEEEGHSLENCCSILFGIYQKCKWCGYIKPRIT